MDDAGGGRRGLRARPEPSLLQALRNHWGLGWPAEQVDLGGSSSLNLLADFDFMGQRARIDDLALTLHCARCDLAGQAGPVEESDRLRRLVVSYDRGLDLPLSAAERAALPVAMVRQPLSSMAAEWPAWTRRRRRAATSPVWDPSWRRHAGS